jgi:hypothetical protein
LLTAENGSHLQNVACKSQFTAFEPFRKIAFSIDFYASTIDAFTLCAYSPRVVDTLAWRSRPWIVFVSCSLSRRKVARLCRGL